MNRIKNKPDNCVECGYLFDENKKYHARGCCNPCYQQLYLRDKMPVKTKREKETHCKSCNVEYGTINAKGRAVNKGSHGLCKPCYSKSKKPKKECEKCGNEMLAGSNTGLCIVCRQAKRQSEGKRAWHKKVKPLPYLEIEEYENVRRLLVRFKYGNNDIVDNFRVVDAYVDVCENPVFLDTLTEEAQVIEMLRFLKKVYDFNKENRDAELKVKQKKAEHKSKYYKYKKKEKKENLTADMQAYRRDYYQKNYANGGYIKYLIKREAKNNI